MTNKYLPILIFQKTQSMSTFSNSKSSISSTTNPSSSEENSCVVMSGWISVSRVVLVFLQPGDYRDKLYLAL